MIASRSPVAGFRRELEAAPRPNKVPTNHAGQWVMVVAVRGKRADLRPQEGRIRGLGAWNPELYS